MATCIALLRGINVGRAKRIAMADLRELLQALGHTQVRTLLNSGNAVFEATGRSTGRIAGDIEQSIAERLGLQVPVVVVSAKELDASVADNPLREAMQDPSKFLVAFAQEAAALAPAQPLLAQSWEPEAFALGPKVAYLWCAAGMIESRIAKAFARATGETATARNWATVLKLQALARQTP